jgi:hypothetical protein
LRREWFELETGKPVEKKANPAFRWTFLTETPDVQIYENRQFLPRAWLANEVRVLTEEQLLATLRTGHLPNGSKWEPLQTVLLETEPGFEPVAGTDGKADVVVYEPNRVEVRTQSGTPSILVLSENHYPGWRAYVDGEQVDVMRVDYNLRGVAVPAGAHTVLFVYRPKSLFIGLTISTIVLLGLGVWLVKRRS